MQKRSANKGTKDIISKMENYRLEYEQWRDYNKKNDVGFFQIFNTFKSSHLADISGGALKAYIYFGIHAKNKTGESWHSTEVMSEFFNVDVRTIKKWIKELEDRGLIARIQKGYKRVANTFLLPYKAAEKIEYESYIIEDWQLEIDSRLPIDETELENEVIINDISVQEIPGALRILDIYNQDTPLYITVNTIPGSINIGSVVVEFSDVDLKDMTVRIRDKKLPDESDS